MSDVQTPAEAQAEKQEAAHKNQVKAEKEFAGKLPKNSDAAQGEVAAPANAKAGTTYPKESRQSEVGTVEYYSAGTAGDNADPDKVFESRDPNAHPSSATAFDDDDVKEAEKAADETRVKVDPKNPYGQADKKFEGNSKEATAKKQNEGAAKSPSQDSGNDGAKADNRAADGKPADSAKTDSAAKPVGGNSRSEAK